MLSGDPEKDLQDSFVRLRDYVDPFLGLPVVINVVTQNVDGLFS